MDQRIIELDGIYCLIVNGELYYEGNYEEPVYDDYEDRW